MDSWEKVAFNLNRLYPRLVKMDGVVVSISEQRLFLLQDGRPYQSYIVSTSRFGAGSETGSYRTPLGLHRVVEKIGDEAEWGAIFRSRINTGEIAGIVDEPVRTTDDNVTTRILWLSGQEPGLNQGEGIDSYQRYIYIHGTHEEGLLGQPASKGCIRMSNDDVIELFEQLPIDTLVLILP
jgi:lipoprotein-anchoring transpeptidase ErfK/SrfK